MRRRKIKYYDTYRSIYQSDIGPMRSLFIIGMAVVSILVMMVFGITTFLEHNVTVGVVCAAWMAFVFTLIVKSFKHLSMTQLIKEMFYANQLAHWAGISSFLWKKKELKKNRFIFYIGQDISHFTDTIHSRYMRKKFKAMVKRLDDVGITPLICFIDSNTHRDSGFVVTAKDAALIMLTFDEFIHPNVNIRTTPYIRGQGVSTNEILGKIDKFIQ